MKQDLVANVLHNGIVQLEWVVAKDNIQKSAHILQQEIFKRFQLDFFLCLLFLGFSDEKIPLSPSLRFFRDFAFLFTQKLIHTPDLESLREKIVVSLGSEDLRKVLEAVPFMVGSEYVNAELLRHFWDKLNLCAQEQLKSWHGSVEDFITNYSPKVHLVGRVYFHLVENKKSEDYPFAFLATYSTGLNDKGQSKHLPLKHALKEYGSDNDKLLELLSTVYLAAKKSSLIAELIESGDIFNSMAWSSSEAFVFLKEVHNYDECGILCRIPNWWKSSGNSLKVNVSVGGKAPAYLGMDSILGFDAKLQIGDTVISAEDIRKILRESEGLAYIKGKWIEVDHQRLNQALDAFDEINKSGADGLTIKEAMRMQLGEKNSILNAAENDFINVSNGDWLSSVVEKLRVPDVIKSTDVPKGFNAKLRSYQQKGLNWLSFLDSLQFGACLADDMGLGKTVQILAFLVFLKNRKSPKINSNLLVLPASLLANWLNEIERFAPGLSVFIAHPGMNPDSKEILLEKKLTNKSDLVLTTYAIVQKYESIITTQWHYVILDEAQAIKNPNTKQTKAVKKLKSYNRIILTGTPIENRLSDLWSLYDFINPGLLGDVKEFSDYSKELNDTPEKFHKLKNVISPYLLRRLKTDKTIISDLPDKIEMKTYADLSKKQIVLYKELVENISNSLDYLTGIQRRGIILSSLMKFKQICNHPGQYLDNKDFSAKDSGKFARLKEICDTIYEKREKVLIFTQFKEMTKPLHDFLKTIFNRDGLVLHGSVSVPKRKELVAQFQSKEYVPFFVLSVKAGGVGLNLTEANHVIHFDRWWNPAVENQATDRVFRIGQKKNVVVHKFITKGTVEEKIDFMLEEKAALSENIIQSSKESWITELGDKEVLDLFRLNL